MADPQELKLKMDERADCLHVLTSGVRSRQTVEEMTMKVFRAAAEKRLSKILVDVRGLYGHFGFADINYLVREIMQDLEGKGVEQVAVIDVKRTIGMGWFLESLAQSCGLNIRVFDGEETAWRWLGV
jgi:hypothetical protein